MSSGLLESLTRCSAYKRLSDIVGWVITSYSPLFPAPASIHMPSTVDEPSVSSQEGQISLTLSLLMLQQFLFGIYTGVFVITIYGYYGKAISKGIITGTMVMLYILTATVVSLDWVYANILVYYDAMEFGQVHMYEVAVDGPLISLGDVGQRLLLNIAQFGGFISADGLLVWRCFHACGKSFRHTVLPMVLIMIEAGLVICATVYTYLILISDYRALEIDDTNLLTRRNVFAARIAGSALISTALTSLVCTFMICRQIYKYTSTHNSGTRSQYRRLLLLLVQSSGAYSATVCVKAILEFIDKEHTISIKPVGTNHIQFRGIPSSYNSIVVSVIVGLVPTLMVASVSLSRSSNDIEVFSGTLSVPLDIGTEEPHFATQSQMADGSDVIHLAADEHEPKDEYDNGNSRIVAGKEVDYVVRGVSITEPCRALQSKAGRTRAEMV
ncbi:hypothetical protein D9613_008030 [Agrocybe pediades]|uniref:Uncharacterized protein n=1 Tax=Agrocybe pediades TaxID=84607 RepID=A0A8H4QN11_9AGAR|nr:hypothetical protein D9613_008030 [Agrocybe pediades]